MLELFIFANRLFIIKNTVNEISNSDLLYLVLPIVASFYLC